MEKIRGDVCVNNGVFYIGNKPVYLITGDYPYYRDSDKFWNKKLKSVKQLGINIITFYVPWRHHYITYNGTKIFDFTGKTAPNRNVIKFLNLCKENNLYVIIKPGPFIHAETNYGGLIDEVCPDINSKIEPMFNIKQQKVKWQNKTLPSPMDKIFVKYIKNWLNEFKYNLLDKYSYPAGPIIAVQIANEGIYSNGGATLNEYDFSSKSLSYFKKHFYNVPHVTEWDYPYKKKDVLKYYKWAEYQAAYVYKFYKLLMNAIKTELPKLINLNPFTLKNPQLDGWFVRNNIEKWKNIEYGFTNWIGLVSYDEKTYCKYLIMIKRGKGFNLEENWGFHKLYDKKFYYPIMPYYQTLLIMANGIKGFNVYTIAATDKWDDNIDNVHLKPYPSSSPITADNKKNNKYNTLKSIVKFIRKHHSILVNAENIRDINYAFYLPEFYLSAWDKKQQKSYWQSLGMDYPFGADKKILEFVMFLRKIDLDFNLININDGTFNKKIPLMFICSGLLDEKTEKKIIEFISNGGIFILLGKIPEFNISGEKLNRLKSIINNKVMKVINYKKGRLIFYNFNPLKSRKFLYDKFSNVLARILDMINHNKVIQSSDKSEAFIQYDKYTNTHVVYVFNKESVNKNIKININSKFLKGDLYIRLVSRGAGIVIIRNDRVIDTLIKKENELEKKKLKKIFFNFIAK